MSDKKISARDYLKQLEILDMQINDDLAGFEIIGRVTLKHKKSGRIFR